MSTDNFIDGLTQISHLAAATIGAIGVAIIVYGAVKGLIMFSLFTRRKDDLLIEIRIDMAKHLSLGLEFLVAKDIIETIVRPTVPDVLLLGVIVAIRTFISHMLSREIRDATAEVTGETKFEEALEKLEDAQERRKKS